MLSQGAHWREAVDELPMLSLSIQSGPRASNDDRKRAFTKRVAPDVRHEHLLKSGPLAKCNDPLCTTCPAYFSSNLPNSSYHHYRPSYASGRTRGYLKELWVFLCNLYVEFPRGIINPHTKAVQRWNRFFVISCLFAVFLDPLFFFLLRVNQDNKCILLDHSFAKTVIVLRTLTDTIYLMHIILQFRLAYVAPVGTDPTSVNKDQTTSNLVDDPTQVALHYLKTWYFIDFVAVLPLPQIMMAVVVSGYVYRANIAKNLLRVTLLLQNLPRMLRVLRLLAGHGTTGFIFENAWANFVINLSLYVLAGHVVGSSWYLFALQRVNQCLRDACRNASLPSCRDHLDCGTGSPVQPTDERWIHDANATNCLSKNAYVFMYGIYANGVPLTTESSFFTRYVYSAFWGFQQITTLAGNQVPSLFIWEVLFLILVIGLGLLLLTLLIGNMQSFLQALGRRGLEMQLRRYEMEKWMARRSLPLELKKRVRQYERFSWAARRGVDEAELLRDLPEDLHRTIRRVLFMDLVKKVRLLEVMDEHLLDAIFQRLHQKLYIDGSEILRRGVPVQQMLFIVHGTLVSEGEDGSTILLSSGDICGEELLTWCLENATDEHTRSSHGRLGIRYRAGQRAISSRTVICTSSVEAFSLECSGLEEVTRDFNRMLRNPRVRAAIRYESHFIREWAALTIQVFWRYNKRKLENRRIAARRHHRRR